MGAVHALFPRWRQLWSINYEFVHATQTVYGQLDYNYCDY